MFRGNHFALGEHSIRCVLYIFVEEPRVKYGINAKRRKFHFELFFFITFLYRHQRCFLLRSGWPSYILMRHNQWDFGRTKNMKLLCFASNKHVIESKIALLIIRRMADSR